MEENKINLEKNEENNQEQDIKEGLNSEIKVNEETQTVQSPSADPAEVSRGVSNKNKKIGSIAIIAAAVIVLIGAGSVANAGAYKKPIKNYYAAIEKQDGKKYKKAVGKTLVSVMEDLYEGTGNGKEHADELFDQLIESQYDNLVDEYGKKLKISYKLGDKEKLDKDELKEMKKTFKDTFDKKVKISKGYEIEAEVTYKGKDDKETKDVNLSVIKLDGEWIMVTDDAILTF